MPYDVATIELIRNRATETLAAIMQSPKPSYSIDGQQVSWTEYQEMLTRQIRWAADELARAAPYFKTDQVIQSI